MNNSLNRDFIKIYKMNKIEKQRHSSPFPKFKTLEKVSEKSC